MGWSRIPLNVYSIQTFIPCCKSSWSRKSVRSSLYVVSLCTVTHRAVYARLAHLCRLFFIPTYNVNFLSTPTLRTIPLICKLEPFGNGDLYGT